MKILEINKRLTIFHSDLHCIFIPFLHINMQVISFLLMLDLIMYLFNIVSCKNMVESDGDQFVLEIELGSNQKLLT